MKLTWQVCRRRDLQLKQIVPECWDTNCFITDKNKNPYTQSLKKYRFEPNTLKTASKPEKSYIPSSLDSYPFASFSYLYYCMYILMEQLPLMFAICMNFHWNTISSDN